AHKDLKATTFHFMPSISLHFSLGEFAISSCYPAFKGLASVHVRSCTTLKVCLRAGHWCHDLDLTVHRLVLSLLQFLMLNVTKISRNPHGVPQPPILRPSGARYFPRHRRAFSRCWLADRLFVARHCLSDSQLAFNAVLCLLFHVREWSSS
ncbi:hypothetical protein BKA62DRAFT_709609, partial [Auriculariales sp. MPI-PUGE-AT-0066]